jgi:hypothetical protein
LRQTTPRVWDDWARAKKRKLAMSETACIEAALRLWFRKEGIE